MAKSPGTSTAKSVQLEITNFKSLKHINIDTSRVNVFIGKPNSGKSNLLEAMTLFNFIRKGDQAIPSPIRYTALNQLFYDTDTSKEIVVKYDENIATFWYQKNANVFVQAVNLDNSASDIQNWRASATLPIGEFEEIVNRSSRSIKTGQFAVKMGIFSVDGSQAASSLGATISENPVRKYDFIEGRNYGDSFAGYLKEHGENLYSIVRESPEIREWIRPFFDEYGLEFLIDFNTRTFEIQRREKGISYKIPFELTPDTLRRMLINVAAIYSNTKSVILFEEPEAHSFPPYIKELSELIKADKQNTYFITTHSPYFLDSMVEDSLGIKDISFFQVYFEDYQTKIKKLSQGDLDNIWGNGADVFFNIDSLDR
ncbi:MAG TPA: AAA family ATPase [Dinghuibacter sp.]|jgi:AAA15 family ATPase/GTPase|uniref:AAA family ATPase n=1 Tax=Dinghuibacter sp. TaxID=2024697 RepID=UPI002CDF2747|nr:AAA family ATPase [Dinghuibacter sp.]HTJ11502.1 AAA family ATPase [Dinghuibacter sp.]